MIGYGPNYSSGFGAGSPLITTTFANKPAPGPVGSQIYISDIGEYGAVFTSNGSVWSHTGDIEIIQKGKGWLLPSLAAANAATYSQTGTTITVTSVGHNIPATGYNTKDVYLNMGVAATGATIPPGFFSNFTYVSADSFTCTSTISQTGTGTVNTNIAEIIVADLNNTIKGSVLGLDGKIHISFLSSNNNSATTKTVFFNFATNPIDYPNTTTLFRNPKADAIINRHSFTSQVMEHLSQPTLYAVDTSVDFNCGFSMLCEAANDYVAIHSASVYILIS